MNARRKPHNRARLILSQQFWGGKESMRSASSFAPLLDQLKAGGLNIEAHSWAVDVIIALSIHKLIGLDTERTPLLLFRS